MTEVPFSIDISGQWSPKQADAVIAALEGEALAKGLFLTKLDISSFNQPSRCLIQVWCALHDEPISEGWACPSCIGGVWVEGPFNVCGEAKPLPPRLRWMAKCR